MPGFAWGACLKYTGVELEVISDIDMLLFIEKGIRGGICHSVRRNAKTNNKYLKDYDVNKESSFLIYIDYNNIYGKAMCKKFPVRDFKWENDISEIDESYIKNYDEEGDRYDEVDFQYPKELHIDHSNFSFLPERMEINKCKKLACNLFDKKEYVDHIFSLKQALNHGLKIIMITKVLRFYQEDWLRPYIELNTNLRKKAKDDFEKDEFKFLNNAVYGKTMENVRK